MVVPRRVEPFRGAITQPPVPAPMIDGALYLAGEVIWGETWLDHLDHELGTAGEDGTFVWRNQCDGTFQG